MGLFSSKKKVYVSSSMYNLAGDIENRVQFLPTVIASKVIAHNNASMGETIQDALIKGTGIRYRSFARWARNQGYNNQLGLQSARINVGANIDHDVLAASIVPGAGFEVAIQTAEVGLADYGFWVDQWMLENHPSEVDESYEIDFDELTNTITMTFASDGRVYSFQPVNFDPQAQYLYFSYMLTQGQIPGPIEEGAEVIVSDPDDLPDVSDWDVVSHVVTPVSLSMNDVKTTVVSYSDGRPNETSTVNTPHTESADNVTTMYTKLVHNGMSFLGSKVTDTMYYTTIKDVVGTVTNTTTTSSNETLPGGVIKTTTVTNAVQSVGHTYSYKEDEQEITVSSWTPLKVVIYKKGDGNPAYDAMFDTPQNMGEFFPFIPVRIWNNFISEEYMPDQLPWNKKAVKRVFDKKFSFLVDQLESSESLGDIDFAYCVFGTSLNTKENAARKYIYKFFQLLNQYGQTGDAEYQAWKIKWQQENLKQERWVEWRDAQSNPLDPLFGTDEPPRATYPDAPYRRLTCRSDQFNFNMNLNYTSITESIIPGLGKPGAKVGNTWFTVADASTYKEILISGGITGDREFNDNTILMYWQDKADSYRVMAVSGLWHNYMIYGGKGVDIHGPDALNDPEESGFIIPLHEGVFRSMSLKDATQMGTAAGYMVLNSYQVVKQKWYSSTWFKVVLIVAVIIITIVTWGGAAPAGAGVLGTAASVGASIGLAGTAAIIAGAAINALAGMLIAQLIMQASVALLGPEVGAIVGAIAGVAALSMGTSLANGGTAMQGLQNMTSAVNLTKATVAAGKGYSVAVQGKIDEIQDKIEKLQTDYKDKMMEVYNAWSENLGFNKATIDISALSESARVDYVYENLETFMQRTLMTGTDIADITNGLISSFTDASISTQLP